MQTGRIRQEYNLGSTICNYQKFDSNFDADEQLPTDYKIEIRQNKSGQSYFSGNVVEIVDLLTDNILDQDGYRYLDLFHFSFATILH